MMSKQLPAIIYRHMAPNRLIRYLQILLLVLLIHMASRPSAAKAQGNTALVLAFYYAWYSPDSFGAGKTPFQPPAPYYSTDVSVIQRHVDEALSAGIDAFVQSWYGPSPNQTESNFAALLGVASGRGFRAAVDFETGSPYFSGNEDRIHALNHLLATHAQHPSYLRVDGKPIIFFWANWLLSVEEWINIRSQVDPGNTSIWIAEGGRPEYLQVFDGLHLYNIAWAANNAGIMASWAGQTRQAAANSGSFKYWVATAMPGFDDRHLGRGEYAVNRDRGGGSYFQNTFAGAAASSPDMIIITSFNEWAEGSNIEPSLEFGRYYLDLSAQLSASFKSGGIPVAAIDPPVSQTGPAPTAVSASAISPTAAQVVVVNTATPSSSPTPGTDGTIRYTVLPGDTLIGIASRFNLDLDNLLLQNGLNEASILAIGQVLILSQAPVAPNENQTPEFPGAELRDDGTYIYQIQEGDTLIEVALKYGLSLEMLLELNPGLNTSDLLTLNQEIIVGRRLTPEDVGGSTDLPLTASPSPLSAPTQTEVRPTSTVEVTPVQSSNVPILTLTNTPIPNGTSESRSDTTSGIEDTSSSPLIVIAVVVILAALGTLFIYLGRQN